MSNDSRVATRMLLFTVFLMLAVHFHENKVMSDILETIAFVTLLSLFFFY